MNVCMYVRKATNICMLQYKDAKKTRIPITKMKWSRDCLIFIMGILLPYIKTMPGCLVFGRGHSVLSI